MTDRVAAAVALAMEAAAVVLLAVLALRPPPPAVVVTCPPAATPAVTNPAPGPAPRGQVSPDPPTWTPGAARRDDVRDDLRALAADLRRGAFGRDELARRVDRVALALEPPPK